MGQFSRRVQGLQDVFPSSQVSLSQPSVLDESVYPVVLFPGPLARFSELRSEDVVGAAGVLQAVASAVPEDRVRHVLYADVFHDQGAGYNGVFEFAIGVGAAPGAPITLAQSGFPLDPVGIPANAPYALNNTHPRGVFVSPRSVFIGNLRNIVGFAFIAPAVVTLRLRFIDYPLADLPSF